MPTISVTHVSGLELHHQYPMDQRAQPCFVELDVRTGALSASYNPEIGNAVPMDVFNQHVLRWDIPAMKEAPANALLARIAPIAQRVVNGYQPRWDGANYVGEYAADADDARDDIADLCDAVTEGDRISVWNAGDLFGPLGSMEIQASELGITPSTSDEGLDAIAAEVLSSATEIDIVSGLPDYLRKLRQVALPKAA